MSTELFHVHAPRTDAQTASCARRPGNVRRWVGEPLAHDANDRLPGLPSHRLPLEQASAAYAMFQKKKDGCIKVVLDPAAA